MRLFVSQAWLRLLVSQAWLRVLLVSQAWLRVLLVELWLGHQLYRGHLRVRIIFILVVLLLLSEIGLILLLLLVPLGCPLVLLAFAVELFALFYSAVLIRRARRTLWQPALVLAAVTALAELAGVVVHGLNALERTVLAALGRAYTEKYKLRKVPMR